MAEWHAVTVATIEDDQIGLVVVDNAIERGRRECTVPDPVAFQLVERHTMLEFQVKIERLPSCNRLRFHRVKFDENDIKSLELFSFHYLLMRRLARVHALVDFRATIPNQMVHSIVPNSVKITPSTIPIQ